MIKNKVSAGVRGAGKTGQKQTSGLPEDEGMEREENGYDRFRAGNRLLFK